MKKKLFLLAVIVVTLYALKPKKVEAGWDFNRHTGTWTNDGGCWYSCHGTWWNDQCIGTNGSYNACTGVSAY